VKGYLAKEKEEIRLKRAARAAGDFYVPAQPKVYFVVRIRGCVPLLSPPPSPCPMLTRVQCERDRTEAAQDLAAAPAPADQQRRVRQVDTRDAANAASRRALRDLRVRSLGPVLVAVRHSTQRDPSASRTSSPSASSSTSAGTARSTSSASRSRITRSLRRRSASSTSFVSRTLCTRSSPPARTSSRCVWWR
jgi:hypothetical protein